jgi:hypothetical protein
VALPAPAATAPPAASRAGGPAIPANYTGLGARGPVFARSHQESPATRRPGVPLVSGVTLDAGGRVTGYEIQFNDRPPRSDYERLVSAAGVGDLPRDRITVGSARNCLAYGSPSLRGLIGVSYVRVTTSPGTTTARVQSTAASGC